VVQKHMSTQTSGAEHVEQVIGRAQQELESLLKQRAEIIKRIGNIKHTIRGLINLFGDEVIGEELLKEVHYRSNSRQPGFTTTCRTILMESNRPLLTQEVGQEIARRNPAWLARQKAPLVSVSTVLHRLASYGEARSLANDSGQRTWQWVRDNGEHPPDSFSQGNVSEEA
jgi:hypothetical protein